MKNLAKLVGIITIVAVIGLLAACSGKKEGDGNLSESDRRSSGQSAMISIDSLSLSKEYEENAVKADIQYKGKLLQITGPVGDLQSYSTGYEFDFADGIPAFNWVNVRFKNSEVNKLANLTKGQIVTIIGTCEGKSGNIHIRNAVIAD